VISAWTCGWKFVAQLPKEGGLELGGIDGVMETSRVALASGTRKATNNQKRLSITCSNVARSGLYRVHQQVAHSSTRDTAHAGSGLIDRKTSARV
jgi:hypothetical protein